jgi:hypothetical protein
MNLSRVLLKLRIAHTGVEAENLSRRPFTKSRIFLYSSLLLMATSALAVVIPNLFSFQDATGAVATFSSTGSIDTSNPFFQSLGTNGRTCGTCHLPSAGMGLNAQEVQERFVASQGQDPIFAAFDGATCPNPASGTLDFSLVLNFALIRIPLPVPANAQFTIAAVEDPYGCASVRDNNTGQQVISVYRRPIPSTNLRFLSSVMFDGRETVQPLNSAQTFADNLFADLKHQALSATLGHARAATPPTDDQLNQIVNFELALNSAQVSSFQAGDLTAAPGNGGPVPLTTQLFFPGINDPVGLNPTGAAFNPVAFTLFNNYANSTDRTRRSIARGQNLFNTHPLVIQNVTGLNDRLNQPTILGTCTTCHDSPNVGDHSVSMPLDIGTSHPLAFESDPNIAAGVSQLPIAILPVFQVTCTAGPLAGQTHFTSDPGRAMISGQCADLSKGKGLTLRGLASRAPYFHNGSAATLMEAVGFYNLRFQANFTPQDMVDLVNFLQSL